MSDETFRVELRLELKKTLEQLREASVQSDVLDTAIGELQKSLVALKGDAESAGDFLRRALGTDLEKNAVSARAAIDIIKAGFKELIESGRSLEEISVAFNKLGEAKFRSFGEDFQKAIRASAATAVGELRDEFKALDQQVKQSEQVAKSYSEVARRGFGDPLITAQQFREQVDLVKQQMIQLQLASGLALKDIVQGFREANAVSGQFSSGVISTAADELKELGSATQQVTTQMGALDQISTIFFGTTLGNLALSILRRLVSQFDELIDRGIEFSRTQFVYATAIRALQRIGLDITFAEVEAQVQKLSATFTFFTERQVREGVGQILLLTRNLKLTKEEMFELTEATAALAVVTGKDFGEEGLLVARAIASGYTEALQRAGIEASRFRIQQEAAALGIDKAFNAMTQAERAAVTLRLVLDQVGNISEDVALFQETLAGRAAEATANMQEQADILGKKLSPAWVFFLEVAARALEGFVAWLGIAQVGFFAFVSDSVGGVTAILAAFESLKNGVALSVQEIVQIQRDVSQELLQTWVDEYVVPTQNIFGDLEIGIPDVAIDDAADDLREQAEDLREQVEDVLRDYQQGLVDASVKFLRRGQDIELRFERKGADEELKFQQDLEKLNRDTTDKIADKQDEYRERELKAERDFQEKLLRLREGFLFDLEDALHERDARQVLRLIRQFNLRQTQLGREFENEKIERQEAFEDEIEEIQLQRERRIRELQIEFEQRKVELELQRQREYQDRQIAYDREIADLIANRNERIAIIKEGLDAELQLYVDYANNVVYVMTQAAIASRNALITAFGGGQSNAKQFTGETVIKPVKQYEGKGYAEGGTLIANKPTMAIFGEKGPEEVKFSPIGRIGRDENKIFGNGGFLPGGGEGGRTMIEILLSPELEARIVDHALGEMGEVIIRTLR